MKGVISSFRRGRHHQTDNQMVVLVNGINDSKKARELVGKAVVFKTDAKEPKEIKGKITGPHGNKGAVKVLFEKGMPGQALAKQVEIQE